MSGIKCGEHVYAVLTQPRLSGDGDVRWVDWSLKAVGGPVQTFGEVVAQGYVKSDGCHEVQSMHFHGCIPEDLDALLKAVREALKVAASKLTYSEVEW